MRSTAHLRNEELRLPADIDYAQVGGLSNEARQRLCDGAPGNLGTGGAHSGIDAGRSVLAVGAFEEARSRGLSSACSSKDLA